MALHLTSDLLCCAVQGAVLQLHFRDSGEWVAGVHTGREQPLACAAGANAEGAWIDYCKHPRQPGSGNGFVTKRDIGAICGKMMAGEGYEGRVFSGAGAGMLVDREAPRGKSRHTAIYACIFPEWSRAGAAAAGESQPPAGLVPPAVCVQHLHFGSTEEMGAALALLISQGISGPQLLAASAAAKRTSPAASSPYSCDAVKVLPDGTLQQNMFPEIGPYASDAMMAGIITTPAVRVCCAGLLAGVLTISCFPAPPYPRCLP